MAIKDFFLSLLLFLFCLFGLYQGWEHVRLVFQGQLNDIHILATSDNEIDKTRLAANDNISSRIDLTPGTLDWKLLAKAKLLSQGTVMTVHYNPDIMALNHTTLHVKGFMFPLEQTVQQHHFLLSPYPPSCPFCLPAGPSELIEVTTKKSLPFSYDAITLQGSFTLAENPNNIKEGILYHLEKAGIAPAN